MPSPASVAAPQGERAVSAPQCPLGKYSQQAEIRGEHAAGPCAASTSTTARASRAGGLPRSARKLSRRLPRTNRLLHPAGSSIAARAPLSFGDEPPPLRGLRPAWRGKRAATAGTQLGGRRGAATCAISAHSETEAAAADMLVA